MKGTAQRIYNVLETGMRKLTVLRGLAKSEADFERAIGQLFLLGVVKFTGRKRGRQLARVS